MERWRLKSFMWWLLTGEQPAAYSAAQRELDKQLVWAKFKGYYPLSDSDLRILNLDDEFLDRHGYTSNGKPKF